MPNPSIHSLIIGELLLIYDNGLQQIPGGGKGLLIGENHALLWSTGQPYKLVQGNWETVAPESIPIEDYILVLGKSLENRRRMLNTRIAKLVQNLDSIESIKANLSNLNALDSALRAAADIRHKKSL